MNSPAPTRIVFRVDAAAGLGGGHVMRCLSLAGELARRGASIAFLSRASTETFAPALTRAGFPVVAAGEDAEADCALILSHCAGPADVLVIDSYALAAPYERIVARAAKRVMVIDDLVNRPHVCDLLLDTSFNRKATDYAGLVPPATTMLMGSQYALLRPEFAALRGESMARRQANDPVKRILVSLGLTDVGGITGTVTDALLTLPFDGAVDVVIGPSAPSLLRLKTLAARDSRINLHIDPPDMARLMCDADLAIGAGGTTTWERCCLGLPTVTLVLADNQRKSVATLADAGAIATPANNALDGDAIKGCVASLLHDAARLSALTLASSAICDGGGTQRVSDALLMQPQHMLELRKATSEDSQQLWLWRNDDETRRNSKRHAAVPWEDHSRWFEQVLQNPDRLILIATINQKPAGMVRFDRDTALPGTLVVSIAVDQSRRGAGLGRRMLAQACPKGLAAFKANTLLAEIADFNRASQRIFEACAFVRAGAGSDSSFLLYKRLGNQERP